MTVSKTGSSARLSVSLSPDLLEFLEGYRRSHGLESRSEVVARALVLLRDGELAEAYRAASEEWDSSPDAALWDRTVGDGL